MNVRTAVTAAFVALTSAAAAFPAIAEADILLKNKDRKPYQLAIRHEVTTTVVDVPAGSYLVVTEGARTVQVRDAQGNATGEAIPVSEGDRLLLQNGKLQKGQRAVSEE